MSNTVPTSADLSRSPEVLHRHPLYTPAREGQTDWREACGCCASLRTFQTIPMWIWISTRYLNKLAFKIHFPRTSMNTEHPPPAPPYTAHLHQENTYMSYTFQVLRKYVIFFFKYRKSKTYFNVSKIRMYLQLSRFKVTVIWIDDMLYNSTLELRRYWVSFLFKCQRKVSNCLF